MKVKITLKHASKIEKIKNNIFCSYAFLKNMIIVIITYKIVGITNGFFVSLIIVTMNLMYKYNALLYIVYIILLVLQDLI